MAQQLEKKFVNEFLAEHYFDKSYFTRQWLGLPPMKEYREAYSVIGRWADVIVLEPTLVTIIEAKLEPSPKAIGQLQLYADLFVKTPRFKDYWNKPIKKVLLTTRLDENLKSVALDHQIDYVVFRPDWINYWEKNRFRFPGYTPMTKALGSQ